MSNEREIKRRLSTSSDIQPPVGLLEAIQQEIPEETFGPRATAVQESAGARPWGARLAAAAVVVLAAGLLAVGVVRNGGLPASVEPVSETSPLSEEASFEVSSDEIVAGPVEAVPEQDVAKLGALGYLDAEEADAGQEGSRVESGRRDLRRALRVPAAAPRQAAVEEEESKTEARRERAAEGSLRRQQRLPASAVSAPRDASSNAAAPGGTVESQKGPAREGSVEEASAQREPAPKAKARASAESFDRSPTSRKPDLADADDLADAEAEPFADAEPVADSDTEAEPVAATSELPKSPPPPAELEQARGAAAREVVAESIPQVARRAPASPAPRLQASLGESRLEVERVPGLETVEVVFERGVYRLRARLEPGFGLEIEGADEEWRAVPSGEDRLIRYELEEGLLGGLSPGRRLRLRTTPQTPGVASTFFVTIPVPQ